MKCQFAVLKIGVVLLFVGSSSGCDYNPLAQLSTIEETLENQSARINEIEKKLVAAEVKLFFLELTLHRYNSGTFDPAADQGFKRIDPSVGTLAVSIQDVRPHADGVKVRLYIGHLTSATISGGTFKAKWGPRMPKSEGSNRAPSYADIYAEWQGKLQEQESSFTQELRPGTWNSLTLTLPGIPPEQFGHLELSLDTSQIKLFMAK